MITTYGAIPDHMVAENMKDLTNQIFKLLPYKEQHSELLSDHFKVILFRLRGLTELLPDEPVLLTIMSFLQAAQSEEDFYLYRKSILDSCSLLSKVGVPDA